MSQHTCGVLCPVNNVNTLEVESQQSIFSMEGAICTVQTSVQQPEQLEGYDIHHLPGVT